MLYIRQVSIAYFLEKKQQWREVEGRLNIKRVRRAIMWREHGGAVGRAVLINV